MSKRARSGLALTALLALALVLIPERTGQVPFPHTPVMKARTKATMEEKRENKTLTISYLRALGYNAEQRQCAITLWTGESRFDHLADNKRSSAYGIAQLLGERSAEPELQILHAVRYVEHRYSGSFCRALQHSDRRGWY